MYVFSVLCAFSWNKKKLLILPVDVMSVNYLTTLWNPLASGSDRHKTSAITQYRTPIYTASLPPVECAITVRQLIFLWYVTPCYFCRQASTLWRNLKPPVFSLETYSLPSELQASRAVLVLQRRR
jgi:hypothetical protein